MGLGGCGQGPACPRSHKRIVSCLQYDNDKDHYKSRGFCFCVAPLQLGGFAVSAPSLGTEVAAFQGVRVNPAISSGTTFFLPSLQNLSCQRYKIVLPTF